MEKICEKHGKYQSEPIQLFGRTISETGCPICTQEEEAAEKKRQQEIAQELHRQDLINRGIEPEFFNATLDNYKAESPSEHEALRAARDMAEGKVSKILLLGSNGVGKTHLADALALQLNGVRITMFELSARIRAAFNRGESEIDVLNRFLKYQFIAIDEIGRTKGSEAEKNWISYFLDKCHTRGIRVMLISNRHTAKNLPEDRRGEAIEYYFDNDVISRLRQSTKIVEVTGRDRRAAAKQIQRSGTTMAAV